MTYTGISLGITGHRPDKLGGYGFSSLSHQIKWKMELFFVEKNPIRVISGMALGTDQWAVEVALKLNIPVLALIPCLDQERFWPPQAKAYYRELMDNIRRRDGQVEYVSAQPYSHGCMNRRNQALVEASSEILAVWDGSKGGTSDCVRKARHSGLPITILNPNTMEFKNDSRESSFRGNNDTISEMAEEVGPEIPGIS